MAEFIPPQTPWKDGFSPNTENTIVELHRLLSIFLASQNFSKLSTPYPYEGFDPISHIQSVEEDEITRILLSLAITARVIDDRENRTFGQRSLDCGTLQADINEEKRDALDIREACNKIIHAKTVRFDVEDPEDLRGQRYLNPIIYLYGFYHDKNWRAELDVIKFCKEYVSTVCRL